LTFDRNDEKDDSIEETTLSSVEIPTQITLKKSEAMVIPTDPDGSCLFHSVSWHFEKNSGASALELRDETMDYILNNPDEEFQGFSLIKNYINQYNINRIKDLSKDITPEDEIIFQKYIRHMKKTTSWVESREIAVLAKIRDVVIVIFQKIEGGKFLCQTSTNVFGKRELGIKSKIILLAFDGTHYEPLNIYDPTVKQKVIRQLNLGDQKGDMVLEDNFIHNKARFRNKKEYEKSIKKEKVINKVNFEGMINKEDDEILFDDLKFAKEFAFLTVKTSNSNPNPTKSEGVNELRKHRQAEAKEAVKAELKQLVEKNVFKWQEVDKVISRAIPIIMLQKEKFDSLGSFLKVKARGVVLGNLQEEMEDFMKEAPTASIQTFYIIIFLASKLNIRLRSLDVTGAFLNAELGEEEAEFVTLSEKHAKILIEVDNKLAKFVRPNGTMVAKLQKCLYGLKQSPQRWYQTITRVLRDIGLRQSEHDSCLFYKIDDNSRNYLLLFVDDMLIAFQDADLYNALYAQLINMFGDITEQEGDVISFLGITIRQNEKHITLDQEGFINKMVSSLNLETIPTYSNPAAADFSVSGDRFLTPRSEANPGRLKTMQKLTMAVMYCAQRTRRDVLFLASFLASINCPEPKDIKAIERVIIYLHNTAGKRQVFYRDGDIFLTLYGDASHNLFANSRGQQCEIIYGDKDSAALDMSSVKEKEVTNSSYESELIVQNKVCQKGIKTYLILEELGIVVPKPMVMYSDNAAAVITANQEHINKMGRSKFMNRKIFYLHDQVVAGVIKPTWIATEEMDADIGTKQLKGSLYDYLSNRSFTRQHYEPDDDSEFEESPEDYAESDREDKKIMNQGSHEKDSHLSHKKVDSHTVFINPKIIDSA
jgi:hypothetical protein